MRSIFFTLTLRLFRLWVKVSALSTAIGTYKDVESRLLLLLQRGDALDMFSVGATTHAEHLRRFALITVC
ncbi:hypothetical protein THF1A12_330024 [Vibrio jasicida]|uniref:Secreted protein n=1 Tax=Vibrio jasicida TaxID=766224 RepID=A0AAU9QPM0_9VIBR|nr:hypothetical protein THF1A12_330024 [Vibrio jasicida]